METNNPKRPVIPPSEATGIQGTIKHLPRVTQLVRKIADINSNLPCALLYQMVDVFFFFPNLGNKVFPEQTKSSQMLKYFYFLTLNSVKWRKDRSKTRLEFGDESRSVKINTASIMSVICSSDYLPTSY